MAAPLWTKDELLLLVRAWEEVAPVAGEGERAHCRRIYERFTELSGGENQRTEPAVYLQRSVLTTNYKFILEYERRNESSGGWFALSPRGREELFHDNEATSYRYLDLDHTMFETIDRIKKNSPPKPAPHTLTGSKKKKAKKLKQATAARSSVTEESEESDEPRMLAHEWTHGELQNLVHAWRDEVRDFQSHLDGNTVAKVVNSRIYERFKTYCNGSTTRTQAAINTKRQDLVLSYHFIAKVNAQQRKNKQRIWFSMSKIEKLAIFRAVDRSSHLADMPEDIFVRVGKILKEEQALGLGNRKRELSASESESESESESDDYDDDSEPIPRRRAQARESGEPRNPKNQKKLKCGAIDGQPSLDRRHLHRESASRGVGDDDEARNGLTKRPMASSAASQLREVRQIAIAQVKQSRRLQEIVDELVQSIPAASSVSAAVPRFRNERANSVARSASAARARSQQKVDRARQLSEDRGYGQQASSRGGELRDELWSTRTLAQETILQLQNQGARGVAWNRAEEEF